MPNMHLSGWIVCHNLTIPLFLFFSKIEKGLENQIISQYKFVIWMYRNIAKRKKTPSAETIKKKIGERA